MRSKGSLKRKRQEMLDNPTPAEARALEILREHYEDKEVLPQVILGFYILDIILVPK